MKLGLALSESHCAHCTSPSPHFSPHAQSSFVGAIAIGDLVKSTLGPKGMDKILVSYSSPNNIQVTNDGATILRSIGVDNPAAKVLVEISKVQDMEVGDGTTRCARFSK